MSGVTGWIVTSPDGVVVVDDFGAVTSYTDWMSATAAARALPNGGQLKPLLKAKPAVDSPRRGRRPKQQEDS